MTTYTPRPHEDYIEWIDKEIAKVENQLDAIEFYLDDPKRPYAIRPSEVTRLTDRTLEVLKRSLLANKATLERHKEVVHYKLPTREQKKAGMDYTDPTLAYSTCSCGFVKHYTADDGYPSISVGTNTFPCPSLLDVTNQLDEVMN